MKIDFTKVVLRDIAGKPVKGETNIHKTIANCIHFTARSVDMIDIARNINQGVAVELLESQIREIKNLVMHPQSTLAAFAKVAVQKYLDARLNSVKKKKAKKPDGKRRRN